MATKVTMATEVPMATKVPIKTKVPTKTKSTIALKAQIAQNVTLAVWLHMKYGLVDKKNGIYDISSFLCRWRCLVHLFKLLTSLSIKCQNRLQI